MLIFDTSMRALFYEITIVNTGTLKKYINKTANLAQESSGQQIYRQITKHSICKKTQRPEIQLTLYTNLP